MREKKINKTQTKQKPPQQIIKQKHKNKDKSIKKKDKEKAENNRLSYVIFLLIPRK